MNLLAWIGGNFRQFFVFSSWRCEFEYIDEFSTGCIIIQSQLPSFGWKRSWSLLQNRSLLHNRASCRIVTDRSRCCRSSESSWNRVASNCENNKLINHVVPNRWKKLSSVIKDRQIPDVSIASTRYIRHQLENNDNYLFWKSQMVNLLWLYGLKEIVNGSIAVPERGWLEFEKWERKN